MIQVPAQHQTDPAKAAGQYVILPDSVKPFGAKWNSNVPRIATLGKEIEEYQEEQKKDKKLSEYNYLELKRFFCSENAR